MVKILITSYYDLKDSLLSAANSLKNKEHDVTYYPLLQNKDTIGYIDDIDKNIKDNKIDIILWWYIGIPSTDVKEIISKNTNVKNIYFNWDDPYNWDTNNLVNKVQYFDCSFVTCEESLNKYIKYGSKKAIYILAGCDENINYPIINKNNDDVAKYTCDISFCCTNLYDDDMTYPNQYINRKILVDNIYKNQEKYGYTFFIYGPESLKHLYPLSYKGYADYMSTNKVFNYSKINLCTHVMANKNKYINERCILIMSSGGLLFVDKIKGITDILDNDTHVLINKDNYLNQILYILYNYEKFNNIKQNAYRKSKQFTWDKWANIILMHL